MGRGGLDIERRADGEDVHGLHREEIS